MVEWRHHKKDKTSIFRSKTSYMNMIRSSHGKFDILFISGLDTAYRSNAFFCEAAYFRGSVYWQTVTVCQLEIIGRPCKKYLLALAPCRNLLNSAVIVPLLYRATGVCQQGDFGITFTNFVNDLPIISNWQTVTVCQ